MSELKEFYCLNGKIYMIPKNHCAFCKNCVSIFCDYENGPYLFICDLGKDWDENCSDFEEEDDD